MYSVDRTFHSDYEFLPNVGGLRCPDEIRGQVQVVDADLDFVYQLGGEASLIKAWLDKLPDDWKNDRTRVYTRPSRFRPGYANSTPGFHLDNARSHEKYKVKGPEMEQILGLEGEINAPGTRMIRGDVDLSFQLPHKKHLHREIPWERSVELGIYKGTLTEQVLKIGERVLMTGETLHAPEITRNGYGYRSLHRVRRWTSLNLQPMNIVLSMSSGRYYYWDPEHKERAVFRSVTSR
jgi:hypothetical protein